MTSTATQGDIIHRFFTLKSTRPVRHGLALLLIASPFLLTLKDMLADHWRLLDGIIGLVFFITLIYGNMYVLVPRFFYKGRYLRYLFWLNIMTITIILSLYLLKKLLIYPNQLKPFEEDRGFVLTLLAAVIFVVPIVLITTTFKLFQRWTLDATRINELETRNLESELKALRNQINPHFLFNMLNNINTLVKKDPDRASFLIIKLSDFLRYLLYESNESSVFLSAEIKFITDFLGLEKVRRDEFEFSIDCPTEHIRGVRIPPHLLITLVENAIKHSVNPGQPSSVKLTVQVENKHLLFTCVNTVPAVKLKKLKGSGVGLTNITRRLELLYQQNFVFTHHELDQVYVVNLTLPL